MNFEEYNGYINSLIEKIGQSIDEGTCGAIKSVYGIPRGGYYPAIKIAQAFNVPIVTEEKNITPFTLIVDDLCDSGKTIAKYPHNNTAVVICKERSNIEPTFYGIRFEDNSWITFPDETGGGVEDNIRRIFQHIGEDPDRIGLQGTPDRIVRMWKEIFRGYDPKQKPKITTFPNGEDGLTYDNMVIDEGQYYSECEHHMMPFFGHYWFAYIPNPRGRILGISKIGRVVDYCAAKLQVQERLTKEVVDMIADALGSEYPPLGIALVMKGTHLCKTMRGARKEGTMTSSYLTGLFKDDAALRSEFMNFVRNGK